MQTIIDYFNYNTKNAGSKPSLVLLNDRGEKSKVLTFSELHQEVHKVAGHLQKRLNKGDRALLLYKQNVDFIIAFMACQYIGVVAVPMSFYSSKSVHFQRVRYILKDADVSAILSTQSLNNEIQVWNESSNILCIATDNLEEIYRLESVALSQSDLAFLQYTSGSTSDPKGVMVSHGNLLHNSLLIKHKYQHSSNTVMGGWLPYYHDMGLIGLILQSLYLGATLVLMSPIAFVKNPMNWLKAISEYKITTSGGPNFCFEHCVKLYNPNKLLDVDLSHWKNCFNGAEPIREKTIDTFAKLFSQYGFKGQSFYPCYGLAEATLFVTGGNPDMKYRTLYIDSSALSLNKIIEKQEGDGVFTAVSSGWSYELDVIIVNPESKQQLTENEVGEIWVSGSSVAKGYWGKISLSDEVFHARTNPENGKEYLRTGDLGFLNRNELFVTGRLKDLIIINGKNIYPQDIEEHVTQMDPVLFSGYSATFSLDHDHNEKIVIVQEISNRSQLDKEQFIEIKKKINLEISANFQTPVASIEFMPKGSLPRTTSGKVQRRRVKDLWLKGELTIIDF